MPKITGANNRIASGIVYGLLAATAGVTFLMPATLTVRTNVASGGGPETVQLNGIVRDFLSTHTDFGTIPAAGLGHYAGTVNLQLPGSLQPLFSSGTGFRVSSQWTDSSSRPIAPHLSGVAGFLQRSTLGFRVSDTVEFKSESMMDAFNSTFGPYGDLGNYGRDAFLSTNSTAAEAIVVGSGSFLRGDVSVGVGGDPAVVIDNQGLISGDRAPLAEAYEMPELVVPDDLDGYNMVETIIGAVTLEGDTTPDDDSDDPALHYGQLTLSPGSTLTVDGDLRIFCDRGLQIDDARIVLLPEANLTFYVNGSGGGNGDVVIKGGSLVNTATGDTTLVSINALGTGKLQIDKSHVYATIVAPERKLEIKHAGHLYGAYIGKDLKVADKNSGIHEDNGNADVGQLNFAIAVREKIELDDAEIDAFDSNEGPYGAGNNGSYARISTNAIKKKEKIHLKSNSVINGNVLIGPYGDIDEVVNIESGSTINGSIGYQDQPYPIPVVAPPPLGTSVGDREYNGGSHAISADLYCKKLKLKSGAIVTIHGERTIRIDDKLEMEDGSEIRLAPGATLTLYVKKDIKLDKDCKINMNTGNPQLVSLRRTSVGKKGKIELKDGSAIAAWAQGAKTELKVEDNSAYYGSFTGRKVKIKKSRLHVDMAYLTGCSPVSDSPGSIGAAGAGGITSTASFSEWFRDVPGINQGIGYPITLTKNLAGEWECIDNDFHPIDDRLLGNEGQPHNAHFTYSIAASFTYADCGGQFWEFAGGDGAWLFIDGKMVMDLGGMGASDLQFVDFDRLGLDAGQEYHLNFYYAQRRASSAVFRLRTNLDLSSDKAIPNVTAMFD
ncbi:MAG: fibro-slime domain-containing protein [Phycisphaerales bacterium]|nr:fibro-slime domain-containing protein [Phycisphaerales bacterium]